jgi:spore coat polysaccharide biosynthesis protein SpsF
MIGAIVQARLGSARLPNKSLKDLGGKTVIERVVERLKLAKNLEKIVVTTPDQEIITLVRKAGAEVNWWRGRRDVLAEYFAAAMTFNLDTIVRVTGDCPCVDPEEVDRIIGIHLTSGADYTYNRCDNEPEGWVDGLDVEVFTIGALEDAYENATKPYEREHVTPYMRENLFCMRVKRPLVTMPDVRLSINTQEDYDFISGLYERLPENFTTHNIKKLIS